MNRKTQAIRLRRLQGRLGEVAYEITKVHFERFRHAEPTWQPAVNFFQCNHCFRICVELAGVDPQDVELTVQPGRLIIRGHRAPPEPRSGDDPGQELPLKTLRLLAMEIDYGRFERSLALPEDTDIGRIATAWDNGILWIEIARLRHA